MLSIILVLCIVTCSVYILIKVYFEFFYRVGIASITQITIEGGRILYKVDYGILYKLPSTHMFYEQAESELENYLELLEKNQEIRRLKNKGILLCFYK